MTTGKGPPVTYKFIVYEECHLQSILKYKVLLEWSPNLGNEPCGLFLCEHYLE